MRLKRTIATIDQAASIVVFAFGFAFAAFAPFPGRQWAVLLSVAAAFVSFAISRVRPNAAVLHIATAFALLAVTAVSIVLHIAVADRSPAAVLLAAAMGAVLVPATRVAAGYAWQATTNSDRKNLKASAGYKPRPPGKN